MTTWLKGQSGNPKGRPKDDIRHKITSDWTSLNQDSLKNLLDRLLAYALQGDLSEKNTLSSIRILSDLCFGRPPLKTIEEDSQPKQESLQWVRSLPDPIRQEAHQMFANLLERVKNYHDTTH